MKRIEFIAPVEAMRGNLSGAQTLHYAENDNPAYDAPLGRNYARDYRPSFIGAKVAKSGKKYFAVKTKSATTISTRSKKAMAVLGGTGAVIAAILVDAARKAALEGIREWLVEHGQLDSNVSLRKYMSDIIMPALRAKNATIRFAAGTGTTPVEVNNPWVSGGSATDITAFIKDEILVKFTKELAVNGAVFYVEGFKGITWRSSNAQNNWAFASICGGDQEAVSLNVLGLSLDSESFIQGKVCMGDLYLLDAEGNYVNSSVVPADGQKFTLTEVAPA